jgi:cytochrome c biogenesis protein CcdA
MKRGNHIVKKLIQLAKEKQVLCFYLLTFLISWTIWFMAPVLTEDPDIRALMQYIGYYGPALAAIMIAGLLGLNNQPAPGLRYWITFITFFRSVLFGMVFSVSWTPCVGAFLGSALMLATQSGSVVKGVLMLLAYSIGLGIPFILSALLIAKLKSAFDFIKKHYGIINKISGIFLIVVGLLMATGLFGSFLSLLSY